MSQTRPSLAEQLQAGKEALKKNESTVEQPATEQPANKPSAMALQAGKQALKKSSAQIIEKKISLQDEQQQERTAALQDDIRSQILKKHALANADSDDENDDEDNVITQHIIAEAEKAAEEAKKAKAAAEAKIAAEAEAKKAEPAVVATPTTATISSTSNTNTPKTPTRARVPVKLSKEFTLTDALNQARMSLTISNPITNSERPPIAKVSSDQNIFSRMSMQITEKTMHLANKQQPAEEEISAFDNSKPVISTQQTSNTSSPVTSTIQSVEVEKATSPSSTQQPQAIVAEHIVEEKQPTSPLKAAPPQAKSTPTKPLEKSLSVSELRKKFQATSEDDDSKTNNEVTKTSPRQSTKSQQQPMQQSATPVEKIQEIIPNAPEETVATIEEIPVIVTTEEKNQETLPNEPQETVAITEEIPATVTEEKSQETLPNEPQETAAITEEIPATVTEEKSQETLPNEPQETAAITEEIPATVTEEKSQKTSSTVAVTEEIQTIQEEITDSSKLENNTSVDTSKPEINTAVVAPKAPISITKSKLLTPKPSTPKSSATEMMQVKTQEQIVILIGFGLHISSYPQQSTSFLTSFFKCMIFISNLIATAAKAVLSPLVGQMQKDSSIPLTLSFFGHQNHNYSSRNDSKNHVSQRPVGKVR